MSREQGPRFAGMRPAAIAAAADSKFVVSLASFSRRPREVSEKEAGGGRE